MADSRCTQVICGGALFAAGLAMRLVGFDGSLWLDELGTLWTVESTLAETWRRAIEFQGQTPFYYLLPWAASQLLGESEVALRLSSLVSIIAATGVLWLVGHEIAGRPAAWLTAGLFWLCIPAVAESANARPYALAMLAASVATLGFVRSAVRADRAGRLLWIAGATALIWTHFVEAIILFGFLVVYLIFPPIRERYRPRMWALDGLAIGAFGAVASVQIADLWARLDSLSWIDRPAHFLLVFQVLPFLLPAVSNLGTRRAEANRQLLQVALVAAAVCHIALLELLWSVGVNLIAPRYGVVAVVPMAAAAGVAVASLRRKDAVGMMAAFGIFPLIVFSIMMLTTGTFTGAGTEDWRCGVDTLRQDLGADATTPVLFRPGFVESDLVASGAAVAATLAPLRPPGEAAPPWRVVELTYRWENPAREAYFAREVAGAIEDASRFYLVTLRVGSGDDYSDRVGRWVAERWPQTFEQVVLGACRGINVVRFERR